MKKKLHFNFLLLVAIAVFSVTITGCHQEELLSTNVRYRTVKTLEPQAAVFFITPVAADLKIKEPKIVYEEIFIDVVAPDKNENDYFEYVKTAKINAAKIHQADIIVVPTIEYETVQGTNNLKVIISGYPATYTNFRPATTKDSVLLWQSGYAPTTETSFSAKTVEVTKVAEKPGKIKSEQSVENPFCLTIGYTGKNHTSVYDNSKSSTSALLGQEGKMTSALVLGISRVWEIKYGIGIETGLNIELPMEKLETSTYGDYINLDKKQFAINPTLSIPLRVQYRYEIFKDFSVFAYTGFTFDWNLFTYKKTNSHYSVTDPDYQWLIDEPYSETDDYSWFFDDYYAPFNMSWCGGIGVQYKFLKLSVGTEWGMLNLSKVANNIGDLGDNNMKSMLNRPITVSLSFLF